MIEKNYIMIKGPTHQKIIRIINIYAPNNSAPKFMKQKLIELKAAINNLIIITGDFNALCSIMYRMTR